MSDPLAQAYPAPGAFASPPPMPSPSSYPMPVHAGHFAPPHPSGMAPGVAAAGVPSMHQMPPMPPTAQGGYYYIPPTPPAPQAMQPPAAMHQMVPPGGSYFYLQPPVPGQQAPPPGQPALFSSPPSMLPLAQPTPPAMAYGHTPQQPQHEAPHHHKGAGNTFTPNMMSVDRGVQEKATQLRIHRLGRDATPSEFAELFDPFGLVNLVRIVKHKDTQAPRGYGFVYFRDHASALAAVEAAQKRTFVLNGQALEVGFADPQRPLSRRALAHVAFRMRKKQQLEDEAAAAEGTPRSGSVTGSDGMPRMITDATEFRTTSPASAESATATPAPNSDGEDELSRRLRDSMLGASTGLKE